MTEREYDVIIVGGGPGGVSALLWCHSLGLSAVLVEASSHLGGQMHLMHHRIADYPGLIGSDGEHLAQTFERHVRSLALHYLVDSRVEEVDLGDHAVYVSGSWLRSRSLVLATGARKTRLGVPGEDLFDGHGVSYSATRDHPLFAGRRVVVVGGGDSAFENALMLARVCPQVTIVHRSEVFRARASWIREVRSNQRISIRAASIVRSIEGSSTPEHVIVEDLKTGMYDSIPAEGVFIRLGVTPNSELFQGELHLDAYGYVLADSNQATRISGVYAVGDVCSPGFKSIASSVGQGAVAVAAIANSLRTP
jgi:thioredoxin reductase (NADPH)